MLYCPLTIAGHQFELNFDGENRLARVSVNGQPSAYEFDHVTRECRVHVAELGDVMIALDTEGLAAGVALEYRAYVDNVFSAQGREILVDDSTVVAADSASVIQPPRSEGGMHWMAIAGIGLKLFKTVKVVKVALLAASVGVYSVIFSPQFAVALVAILVFHEYGHVRAMKKFGLATKGIYLIPFFGGMAIGERHKSQWQDVYISMMGPVYGLLMSVVFYVIYLFTNSHFCGLVASVSALINLFNLLPVHPLDGGRVIKAMVFSGRNYWALLIVLTLSAACAVVSIMFGLYFLVFFIVLGVIDTLSGWRVSLAQDVTPLSRYGLIFSLFWYLSVVVAFIAMILLIASTGLPGSEIATKVLSS